MSLRLRLTVLCVALVGGVLAVFAVTTYFLASARIYASLDDSLTTEANAILCDACRPGELNPSMVDGCTASAQPEAASGALFQIRDDDGQRCCTPRSAARRSFCPATAHSRTRRSSRAKVANQELRILHQPVDTETHTGGSIEVARSFENTNEALTALLGVLIAGSIIALFLTLFPAYFIAGRALQPLRARFPARAADRADERLQPAARGPPTTTRSAS